MIPAGGGEVVGDSPERRVEILCDDDPVHATWSRFAPGREGADLHVHRRHSDLFYVLEGELTVRLGLEDRQVAMPAGSLARVPPMVVHGFRNASAADVKYLNLHAPGQGFADYMRALRDGRTLRYDQEPPPTEGVRPPSEAVIDGAERLGDGTLLLADTDEIRIAEVSGRAPAPAAYVFVLEGDQAGAWAQPGDSVGEPARFLEIHAPRG